MKSFAVAILTALGYLATTPVANAWGVVGPPPVICSTLISGGSTIATNLIVPANTSCTLGNVTITGNVDVEQGATLTIDPGAGEKTVINGNVDANMCNFVDIAPTINLAVSIGGNLSIKNCKGRNVVRGSTIGNNLVCSNNTGNCEIVVDVVGGNARIDNNSGKMAFGVSSSKISGNLDFSDNTAPGLFVIGNTVGGNLSCQGNVPAPSKGSGNTVTGNTKGQCL